MKKTNKHKNSNQKKFKKILTTQLITQTAFSLIELLVVIAVIGLLASVALVAVNKSREKARLVKAEADLKQIHKAFYLLLTDTGKWPGGCLPDDETNLSEIEVSSTSSGLTIKPPIGPYDPVYAPNCNWTAEDLSKWLGPYIAKNRDPWGNDYLFDPDFYTCEGGKPKEWIALLSKGPDKKQGSGSYTYPTSANSGPNCNPVFVDDVILYLYAKP